MRAQVTRAATAITAASVTAAAIAAFTAAAIVAAFARREDEECVRPEDLAQGNQCMDSASQKYSELKVTSTCSKLEFISACRHCFD